MAGETVRRTVRNAVTIELTVRETEILAQIADFHQRSMGPMRHIVRLTAPSSRSRFRFLDEESKWLRRFAEASRHDLIASGVDAGGVDFTPRAVVAFAGRLLASLQRRSRRKLSAAEISARDGLAGKLCRALHGFDATLVEAELRLRRPDEAQWIREQLAAQ